MNLRITSTSIRKLIEIEMEFCKREGLISDVEREAVRNINGHSSQIVDDFYLKLDRNADAHNGRVAFEKLLKRDGINYNAQQTHDKPKWHFKDELTHAPWGTMHPFFGKLSGRNIRVKWSDGELEYIKEWICNSNHVVVASANRVAKCHQHIQNDHKAYPIFHVNHVLTSARLRTGFEKTCKMFGLLQEHAV